jgi:hypothetical protein
LANPNGNATGLSFLTVELNWKRLELIREVVPKGCGDCYAFESKNGAVGSSRRHRLSPGGTATKRLEFYCDATIDARLGARVRALTRCREGANDVVALRKPA